MTAPEVTVIRDPARLPTLDGEWDDLLARSASDTVFLTWDWLRTWYEIYGAEVEPCVVLVRENGRLVAAAPLKIEARRLYGLRVRQLEFIGTGRAVCPDFLDLVIEAGREAELARVLLGALRSEPGWDRIALSDLPASSPVREPLEAAMTAARLRPFRQVDRTCPYLTLPGTWAELEQRLTHNFRRNHRKKRRRLGAALVHWDAGQSVRDALATLATLHQGRMETSGRGGNFRKPDYLAFHQRFAERAAQRGWLYLAFLHKDGRAIAGRYGFVYRGTYYAYQSGFDPTAGDDSPGEVLLGMVIEDLIGRGVREFNFLRGPQPHKFHWADRSRETLRVEGWRHTALGPPLAGLDRLAAIGRRVRRRWAGMTRAPRPASECVALVARHATA